MVVFGCQTEGTESWPQSSVCYRNHSDHYEESCAEGREENDDIVHLLNCTSNHSQLSTCSIMSKKWTPTLVYQRRKKNNPSSDSKSNDCGQSAIKSEDNFVTGQDCLEPTPQCTLRSVTPLSKHMNECSRPTKSLYGSSSGEISASEDVLLVATAQVSSVCTVNDDCSSSISDLKCNSATSKNILEDAENCPSSVSSLAEKSPQEMSERDTCIGILRSRGLLDTVCTRDDRSSATKIHSVLSSHYRSLSCKICARVENTSRMLVCDSCEDAFHISCCGCHIIPVGEWHCDSCLKKKHVMLNEKSLYDSISVDVGKVDNNQASEANLGSLGFMFMETEPYMSRVRVGDEFQATIPDWRGPSDDKGDQAGDPLNYSNNIGLHEQHVTESSKLSSIGNWIQCRAVVEGIGECVDGTICNKWRRAPLFEVQTNDWECFRCVLWDPAHADCAVPQELITEDVMRQLKYMELLRPRLAAKRRKFTCSEKNDRQSKHIRGAEKNEKRKDRSNKVDPQKQARPVRNEQT